MLTLDGISHRYGSEPALEDVSFSLDDGSLGDGSVDVLRYSERSEEGATTESRESQSISPQ